MPPGTTPTVHGPYLTILPPGQKRPLTLCAASAANVLSVTHLAAVADTVLFVTSATAPIDEFGELAMTCIRQVECSAPRNSLNALEGTDGMHRYAITGGSGWTRLVCPFPTFFPPSFFPSSISALRSLSPFLEVLETAVIFFQMTSIVAENVVTDKVKAERFSLHFRLTALHSGVDYRRTITRLFC